MLKDELTNWGKLIVEEAGVKVPMAAGTLRVSLSSGMIGDDTVAIYGKGYAKHVDLGTGLQKVDNIYFNSKPVVKSKPFNKSILDWITAIENRGKLTRYPPNVTNKQLVYLFMRKIKRDGTPPTQFLTQTISSSFIDLKKKIKDMYVKEIELFVIKEWKKNKKI